MRILLPSATIAASAATLVSTNNDATFNNNQHEVASTTNDGVTKKLTQDVNKSYSESNNLRGQQNECNTHKTISSAVKKSGADVGVLVVDCEGDQTCEFDESSSLGGRCTTTSKSSVVVEEEEEQQLTTPKTPAFPIRRQRPLIFRKQSRKLQTTTNGNVPVAGIGGDNTTDVFVCPTGCPQDFCDCAEDNGDAKKCAAELHGVCEANLLPACVPDKYLTFYIETYCPYASCLAVENKIREECSCDYYKNYCETYYAYEESIEKCAIGECCDTQAAGEKFTCIPALAPTASPTGSPTLTDRPSTSPTFTFSPTISSAPTVSSEPSASPTISTAPTISTEPTPIASDAPSASPTISSEPTMSPLTPTVSPTVSPTDSPTAVPSIVPSTSPTISSAPTISHKPSTSPTETTSPTISSAPTDVPSQSQAPTVAPSGAPTFSVAPTITPTTAPPTVSPTTDAPTTATSTKAPVTPIPTEAEPVGTQPPVAELVPPPTAGKSSGVAPKSGVMASLFVGVGGALWLLA